MILKVADEFSAQFVQHILDANRHGDETFHLKGGGTLSVVVFSLPKEEMLTVKKHGKVIRAKRFSLCRADSFDQSEKARLPVTVSEGGLFLVLNRDELPMLRNEAGHIMGLLKKETQSKEHPNHRGRAGAVVFNMDGTGRVLSNRLSLPNLFLTQGNHHVAKVFEAQTTVVSYGATDASNLFEAFLLAKLACYLGLPAIFDTYDSAYTVADYLSRIFNPSLWLLVDKQVDVCEFDLQRSSKFRDLVSREVLVQVFERIGLGFVSARVSLSPNVQMSFNDWYRWVMEQVVTLMVGYNDVHVSMKFVSTEEFLLKGSSFWHMSVIDFAVFLQDRIGHAVVACYLPDGTQISTDDWGRLPRCSIAKLHELGGWLGGAANYYAAYSLGAHGPFVYLVKDSAKGRVHQLAEEFMVGDNQLYLAPVGLFRLSAVTQPEDWSIDPFVFWELLLRWGEEKSGRICQKIWHAMEVPLMPENIGQKTVVRVHLDGIEQTVC